MRQEHSGILFVVLSAVCYGFIAIFVKFAYAGQVNLTTILAGRFVLAALFMWLLVFIRKQPVSFSSRDILSLLLISILGYWASSTLFFASLRVIPASLASLLLFTHPVMVSVAEAVIYRYRLTPGKISALALSTAGLIMVLGNIGGEVDPEGVMMALGAAVFYTAYLLYGQRVVRKHPPDVVTAYLLTFAAVGFTSYGAASGGIFLGFPASSWIWILAMAFVSTFSAVLFLFAGLKRLEAGKASVISTLEVVFTVLFSSILLGDSMNMLQIAGGLMIVSGIVILRMQPDEKFLAHREGVSESNGEKT